MKTVMNFVASLTSLERAKIITETTNNNNSAIVNIYGSFTTAYWARVIKLCEQLMAKEYSVKILKEDAKITTSNNKAVFGTVYEIRGCLREKLLLTLNTNGVLYYVPSALWDNLDTMSISQVLPQLHRSCHTNDLRKVMHEYCVLNQN